MLIKSETSEVAISKARAVGLDPGILGLTIFPTEKCNFRCVYCYEEFPNVRLSDDVASGIINLIRARSRDLHSVSVGWFGGEPLLESKRIFEISEFIQAASVINNFAYIASMTTNGYLLDFALFERLVTNGIKSFQISLDGMEIEHNKTRVFRGGGGSFADITRNLLAIRGSSLKFDILLRVHVHKTNVASVIELAHYIKDNFLHDGRFKVIVERIKNWVQRRPLSNCSQKMSCGSCRKSFRQFCRTVLQ